MRSQMDEYNKIQRHKGTRERNGWVKLRVGKWWNEANLLRHITKIPIFALILTKMLTVTNEKTVSPLPYYSDVCGNTRNAHMSC